MADIIDVPGMATLINNAVDLYDEGLLPECEAATRAILKHRLSRWQEIYCLALLADCLDDWYEAEKQRYWAETMWRNSRFSWPPKNDATIDAKLDDLRETLDEVRENQKAWRPEYDDEYDEFMVEMYQKHSRVMQAEGEWNEMLRKRSQEAQERELAEIEEYEAQERAEEKERKAREREKMQEEAIEDVRHMFGQDDEEQAENEDEENLSPEVRAWLDPLPKGYQF